MKPTLRVTHLTLIGPEGHTIIETRSEPRVVKPLGPFDIRTPEQIISEVREMFAQRRRDNQQLKGSP